METIRYRVYRCGSEFWANRSRKPEETDEDLNKAYGADGWCIRHPNL